MAGKCTYVSLHDTKRTYLKIQKTPANAMKEMTYDRFVKAKYIQTTSVIRDRLKESMPLKVIYVFTCILTVQ